MTTSVSKGDEPSGTSVDVEHPQPDAAGPTEAPRSARRALTDSRRAWENATLSRDHRHASDFIYDWNKAGRAHTKTIAKVKLLDETLRDGLQSPSVVHPPIEERRLLLRHMDRLGIEHADIGLPGAGPAAVADVTALCETIRDERLGIRAACAGRTLPADVDPIIAIAEATGVPIEILTFLAASPIRTWCEDWSLADMRARVVDSVRRGVKAGLEVAFVTEDTVRSHPDVLSELFRAAIGEGATRLILCDTVGHATPEGVYELFAWTLDLLRDIGATDIGLDFHGHNDRGMALVNAIVALKAGADRVHGTALGIGERAGNCAMDQLLVNLVLSGAIDRDLTSLQQYAQAAGHAFHRPIPDNYPVVGRDAFRTATGVHASAIVKAWHKAGDLVANHVYSGVPSHIVGKHQIIAIGPYSGDANILAWLVANGVAPNPTILAEIRRVAKAGDRTLTDEALHAIIERCIEGSEPP